MTEIIRPPPTLSTSFARKKELLLGVVSVWEVLGRVAIISGPTGAARTSFLEIARVFVHSFFVGDLLTTPVLSTPFASKKYLPLGVVSVWEVLGRVTIISGPIGAARELLLESARVFMDSFCDGDNSIAPALSTPFARKKELSLGVVNVWEVLGRVVIILAGRALY